MRLYRSRNELRLLSPTSYVDVGRIASCGVVVKVEVVKMNSIIRLAGNQASPFLFGCLVAFSLFVSLLAYAGVVYVSGPRAKVILGPDNNLQI